ncbi:MAG: DUF3047 domain-containing protein [Candidatus Methylomirabilales bacterium]
MRQRVHDASRKSAWSIGLVVLCVSIVAGEVVAAPKKEVVVVDFGQEVAGVPQGWKLSKKTGEADLALVEDGSGPVLRLRSNASSFAIQKEVNIDLTQTPFLVWEWKVTELPEGGDFRTQATDDQAAQLLVMFSPDVLRTEVIAYIWDSTAPKGTVGEPTFPSVYPFLRMRTVVVESGGAEKGKWVTVMRNVVEDYKKLFGRNPDNIDGIRIQINSQHTKSQAEAYWRFVKAAARP